LVELLVVIAIICVLIALLFPVVRGAYVSAKTTVCLHDMMQIGMGFNTFFIESGGKFPGNYYGSKPTWYCEVWQNISLTPQTGSIFPYVNDEKVYVCPLDVYGNGRLSYSSPTILRDKPVGAILNRSTAVLLVHEDAMMHIANGHEEGGFSNIDKGSTIHKGKVTVVYVDNHAELIWQEHDFFAKHIYIAPFGQND
jgi:hypothetical protein